MLKNQLYKQLDSVSALRTSRQYFANIVSTNPKMIAPLVEIIFENDKKISPRAAWVLEFVFKDDYSIIFSHLDYFTSNVSKLKLDSSIRPCAKIIEILIDLYYIDKNTEVLKCLSESFKSRIIEACFDWMITEQKVAVKAYSMNALYQLGTEYNWIHPELKTIMQRDYVSQSAGYKVRSKDILAKIKSTNR